MPMPRFCTRLLCLWTLILPLFSLSAHADNTPPSIIQRHLVADTATPATPSFLPPDQAFKVDSAESEHGPYIALEAAPGYYLYRDRIHLTQAGQDITDRAQFSPPQQKDDPAFGLVSVYHDQARITLPDWQSNSAPIDIRYQGCAEAGLCYPPMQKTLSAPASATSSAPPHPSTTNKVLSAPPIAPALSPWTLLVLFAAGIGLTFTPCVLPMLPIACAIVVGRTPSRRQALGLSLAYVVGMVIAYALLGLVVGLFGSSLQLQAQLQRAWVLVPMAVACIVAAGWLFDLYQLRLPLWLSMRMQNANDRLHQRGLIGTVATGALSTLVLSPCLSAPLAGVLVYLSTTGNVVMAMLGLVALALGMGTPIIICCTFGAGLLPRAGAWMTTVKGLFGLMLLGTALWLLARILPPACTLLLWGIWGLGGARLLGAGLPPQQGSRALLQVTGWAVAIWSVACIAGAAAGGHDPLRPLASFTATATTEPRLRPSSDTASPWPRINRIETLQRVLNDSSSQPLLIDIYADWCTSCQQMERTVYAAPELQPILSLFRGFRLDVTHPDKKTLEFLRDHGLFGPPGVLFFVEGQEAADERIVGERSREEVENHLRAVLNASRRAQP
ncbi:protein-disulfide reductase DsbD [Zymobacter palmae]|uniref:Thiol:disulfide interchange protein n=1 Tax=Zymobacter palmae TaxID=33074 RepID=A0A348HEY7_9GAMM|nr:protein-disulfide reductase DsbD [Zymobacter palmae]BBG30189.1 thiol:disulfide interchange protein precursor [Zymobacter palmae]